MSARVQRLKKLLTLQEQLKAMHELRHAGFVAQSLAAKKEAEDLVGDAVGGGDDLTALSLDDPRQWSMSWTTLPDVYGLGQPHLDEWAATARPEVDPAAQWLALQTVVAAGPISPERLDAFLVKAAREAGQHTRWTWKLRKRTCAPIVGPGRPM